MYSGRSTQGLNLRANRAAARRLSRLPPNGFLDFPVRAVWGWRPHPCTLPAKRADAPQAIAACASDQRTQTFASGILARFHFFVSVVTPVICALRACPAASAFCSCAVCRVDHFRMGVVCMVQPCMCAVWASFTWDTSNSCNLSVCLTFKKTCRQRRVWQSRVVSTQPLCCLLGHSSLSRDWLVLFSSSYQARSAFCPAK